MTKCGDIMWKEEGTWKRQGDTIQVYFRHYTDRRTFVVKKGKLLRVYDDGRTCKPNDRVRIEQY
ncbi:MAG: hypothetical protein MK081_14825 [Flavobacteriales bacterium]|nr:hypothetical protein [Flavobacteriales bacterium]